MHYATLPGSTESYGERTQIRTFENHANLLAYPASWAGPGNVASNACITTD